MATSKQVFTWHTVNHIAMFMTITLYLPCRQLPMMQPQRLSYNHQDALVMDAGEKFRGYQLSYFSHSCSWKKIVVYFGDYV